MENIYITITAQNYYLGMKPYKIGHTVRLVKEPENDYDCEAIRVELPYIDTIGYVANSARTVFDGTFSAGRIFDRIETEAYAKVMFITHSSVIAMLVEDFGEEMPVTENTPDDDVKF